MRHPASCLLLAAALAGGTCLAATSEPVEPATHVYREVGGEKLKAHVFAPEGSGPGSKRPAIVIFHGGGWNIGSPEWAFPMCRYFASRGMVAVAAQYRLADQKTITPIESMADARQVIRWVRQQAADLGVDPGRVAAAGWSAGGHLAASAAIFGDPEETSSVGSSPDALLLWFPAVAVTDDEWFAKLLGDRAEPSELSPAKHVMRGLPPTIVFQGTEDTVTPIDGARRFCDAMKQADNRCELVVYENLGHLFGSQDPDAGVDAMLEADRFLVSEGFLQGEPDEQQLRKRYGGD